MNQHLGFRTPTNQTKKWKFTLKKWIAGTFYTGSATLLTRDLDLDQLSKVDKNNEK